MSPSILYIHGFNSSSASLKARQLVTAMDRLGLTERLRAPSLHHHPREAMRQLESLRQALGEPLLVGSSLGGFYATYLAEQHRLKAVLINPAVRPQRLLDAYRGPQTNYYSGERWEMTEDHLGALAELEVPAPADPSRYQVWLQAGDETLDYRVAEAHYRGCALRIQAGGDHGFQGFAERIPVLLGLAGFDPRIWRDFDFSSL
jgi:hypothetical protein